MSQDANEAQQLDEITDSIIALAQLDFSTTPPIRGKGPLDAVAAGLIALGEELQASVVARKEAEKANQAKADFLANMSHELRTPLTIIMGNTDLLSNTSLSKSQRRMIAQVKDASGLLLRLINDVLDFSKLEAGTLRFEELPFSLKTSLTNITEQHRPQAVKKGLTLQLTLTEVDTSMVIGDRHRIEQVVSNLLSNAIKFTPAGHIQVSAATTRTPAGISLSLTVEDTGTGIAAERLEHIFERFVTEDSSIRRAQGGTGLGLSISRSLVRAMGGALTVKSTPDQGSSFLMQLPMRIVESEPSLGTRQCAGAPPLHILVVDDTELVRLVTAEMLRELGCIVSLAGSGQEALREVERADFDLILMDCQMPQMDGLETTRQLIARHPDRALQIVAITAHSTQQDERLSTEAGMKAHLRKPYGLGQLRELIRRFDQTKQR